MAQKERSINDHRNRPLTPGLPAANRTHGPAYLAESLFQGSSCHSLERAAASVTSLAI